MELLVGLFSAAIGLLIFVMVLLLVMWVLSCAAHYKALKLLEYSHPIAAWVPFWGSYAVADLVVGEEEKMPLFGNVTVPGTLFKFYWVLPILLSFVPKVGGILGFLVSAVFTGVCYGWMFSALDDKDYSDTMVLGMAAGFIPFIAMVKFFAAKGNK